MQAPVNFDAVEGDVEMMFQRSNDMERNEERMHTVHAFFENRLRLGKDLTPEDMVFRIFDSRELMNSPEQLNKNIVRFRETLTKYAFCCEIAEGMYEVADTKLISRWMSIFDCFSHVINTMLMMDHLTYEKDLSILRDEYCILFDISGFKSPKNVDLEALCNHFYLHCQLHNYRKIDDDLYHQIYYNDIPTRAWKKFSSLSELFYEPQRYNGSSQCKTTILMNASKISTLVSAMSKLKHTSLPELKPCRFNFSFRNGIYFCDLDRFVPWMELEGDRTLTSSKFFDIEFELEDSYPGLETYQMVCQKFETHDLSEQQRGTLEDIIRRITNFRQVPFRHEWNLEVPEMERSQDQQDSELKIFWALFNLARDWGENLFYLHPDSPIFFDIESVATVFETQRIPGEAEFWIWVMLGRMLYPLHYLDKWQSIMFLKGLAGSGKSTILEMVQQFYSKEDILMIFSNNERVFGLQGLDKAKIWMGIEVKSNFSMPQDVFQSAVSGETVNIPVKFKQAFTKNWDLPGMLSGNDPLPYPDASRSITRRLMIVNFLNLVVNPNANIRTRIKQNIHKILLKANKAYRLAAKIYPESDLPSILPRYFADTSLEYRKEIDPLTAFMYSNRVVRDPNGTISLDLFETLIRTFANEHRFGKGFKLNLQHISLLMVDFNVNKVHGDYLDEMGNLANGLHFCGVRPA